MPKIIQLAEISKAVQERFRLVGRTKFQLDETVVPTVLMGDLSEAAFSPKAGGSFVTGVALETGKIQLLNPGGSQVMIVLDRIIVSFAADSILFVIQNSGALADPAATVSTRDLRQVDTTVRGQLFDESSVGGATGFFAGIIVSVLANDPHTVLGPYYLPPGTDVSVEGQPVATTIRAYFLWREIPLQQFGL